MAMEPFVLFHDEFIHIDNTFDWNPFSPTDLSVGIVSEFPDLVMEFESPIEPEASTTTNRSAFTPYSRSNNAGPIEHKARGESKNISERVLDMLRRIPRGEEVNKGVESSRGFRHMMRERQRREKLSQSYADLYSLVSTRSKSDKNSIVRSATCYVRELKEVKDALKKRNEELKIKVLGINESEFSKIKIRVANPTSSIDSMIGALRSLKSMNVKARTIKSDLSSCDFSAIMSIDTKIPAHEVEREVEITLMEIEKKLHRQIPGITIQS